MKNQIRWRYLTLVLAIAIGSTSAVLIRSASATPVAGIWTGGDSVDPTSWPDSLNWDPSGVPGANAGDSAIFGTGPLNTTVSLKGNQTVGAVTFDSQNLYTIGTGAGETLNLNNGSDVAVVDDIAGDPSTLAGHQISASVAIANGLNIAVAHANDVLTFSSPITGNGPVTLTADGNSNMLGTVVFGGANGYTGGTTVNSGTLLVDSIPLGTGGPKIALPGGAISIGGGAAPAAVVLSDNVTLGSQSSHTPFTTPTSNLILSSLSIAADSKLDIGNNHLIINYGNGPDPMADITKWIISGSNEPAILAAEAYNTAHPPPQTQEPIPPMWVGTDGITSSDAAADPDNFGVGYSDAADPPNDHNPGDDLDPAGLASGQIEIAYTILGDANLDLKVNGTDFAILATYFNQAGIWDQGDFNYDGKVNGIDFAILNEHFNHASIVSAVSSADLAALDAFAAANGLVSDVPEPASMGILFLTTAGVLGRRWRKAKS